MSKRLIYAEDAIDALMEILDRPNHAEFLYTDEICRALNHLPSAQPRIKGRWTDVTKTGGAELWKCSECGELELEDSYYCPNCGAEMRGEEDAAD